jgi:hypothetical protein
MYSSMVTVWERLPAALVSGERQNHDMATGDPFNAIYSSEVNLKRFVTAMTGISGGLGPVC